MANHDENNIQVHKTSKQKKILFLILGFVSLVLAYIGVALPGFPGTPFILLTAFFFVRSSDKLYNWLLKNRIFRKIIHEFDGKETIPLKFKLFVILQMWITITVAALLFIKGLNGRLALVVFGILFSWGVMMLKRRSK